MRSAPDALRSVAYLNLMPRASKTCKRFCESQLPQAQPPENQSRSAPRPHPTVFRCPPDASLQSDDESLSFSRTQFAKGAVTMKAVKICVLLVAMFLVVSHAQSSSRDSDKVRVLSLENLWNEAERNKDGKA